MIDSYVYMWTNKNDGRRYIGKGVRGRAMSHARMASNERAAHRLHVDMRSLGLDNFELSYLAFGMDDATARAVESAAIESYGTQQPNGYNGILGRPMLGENKLDHKVCGYFPDDEYEIFKEIAIRMSVAEGKKVTLAELMRRYLMEALGRSGR
jgi:hypothetical protein